MADNKDLKKFRGGIRLESTSAPANAETGALYFDSVAKGLKVHDGTQFNDVGSGSSGGLDTFYVEDFRATPAYSATGGTCSIIDDADSLSEKSLKYIPSGTSAESFFCGASDITFYKRQKGKTCSISFYYTYDGADDDFTVQVKDNAGTILTSSSDLLKSTSTAKKFVTTFTIPSGATSLQWGIKKTTDADNLAAYKLIIDDVEISQDPFVQADLGTITEWQSYTATLNNTQGVVSGYPEAKYRRVGDSIEVKFNVKYDSTGHTSTFSLSLPPGMTFDDAKLPDNFYPGTGYMGTALHFNDESTDVYSDFIITRGSNATIQMAGDYPDGQSTGVVGSQTFGAGDYISGTFTAPITGWGSTNTHIVTPAKSNLTDWTSYTADTNGQSMASKECFWRRVGDSMEIRGKFKLTDAMPGSTVALFGLPDTVGNGSGGTTSNVYSVDFNKLTSAEHVLGYYYIVQDDATAITEGDIPEPGGVINNNTRTSQIITAFSVYSGFLNFTDMSSTSSGTVLNNISYNDMGSLGNKDTIIFQCSVPISGWGAEDHNFLAALPMTKWKKKILTYDVEEVGRDLDGTYWSNSEKQINLTGDGSYNLNTGNSEFIFNNVTEGTYRISGQFRLHVDDTTVNANVKIEVRKNSINLLKVDSYHGSSGTAGVSIGTQSLSFSHIFTVDAGSSVNINFMTHDLRGNDKVKGAADGGETFAILEKLPMHEETDIW
tara:strand:+ start:3930 stop:6080 length:2151 start_codon:yes stop_codon:yes gene_type:complete